MPTDSKTSEGTLVMVGGGLGGDAWVTRKGRRLVSVSTHSRCHVWASYLNPQEAKDLKFNGGLRRCRLSGTMQRFAAFSSHYAMPSYEGIYDGTYFAFWFLSQ